MSNVFDEASKCLLHGQDFVAVTISQTEGSSPGKKGAVMLVCKNTKTYGTIGGGELEKFCAEAALELFSTKKDYSRKFSLGSSAKGEVSMICGGNVTVDFIYVDHSTQVSELEEKLGIKVIKPRVFIFGGGHVARELCPLLSNIGFEVTVLDDRAEFASSSMHPKADRCILCNFSDIGSSVHIGSEDYVVIMTHGHIGDREVLLQACRTDAFYIGCIGSRKKVEDTQKYLRENGISDERIASVCSPIGLHIGGESPAEIAVSVAAQLIQYRYSKQLL